MAHAICAAEIKRRGLSISVVSAGVADFDGVLVAYEARQVCQQHQMWMPKFASTYVGNVDLTAVTRTFVMERAHISRLLSVSTTLSPERISLLGEFDPQKRGAEIEDPIGQDFAAFERCFERLQECIVHYLETTQDFEKGP
jgi:protein-tyrosine-phosphatase